MPDAAAADIARHAARNGAPRPLSPERIDAILADFRVWLEAHGDAEPVERIDMPTLLAQFTALRHEVNLQTKATRTLAEQTAKVLESPATPALVKMFLDIADVLAVSERQIRGLPASVEPLLESLADDSLPPPPTDIAPAGFLKRLLGGSPAANDAWKAWAAEVETRETLRYDAAATVGEKVTELAESAAEGYAMSLRRVERAFPELGLVPIECVGKPFDPETMEVVELGGDGPPGTVTAEIRRGYHGNGALVRYAQVRVAK